MIISCHGAFCFKSFENQGHAAYKVISEKKGLWTYKNEQSWNGALRKCFMKSLDFNSF